MGPQATEAVEIIDIDYNAVPPGQVGARPRKIKLHGRFKFNLVNPGTLTIEFLGGQTPLEEGATVARAGDELAAANSGSFKFKCTLVHPDGSTSVLDPDQGIIGGEIDIPPGS